MRVRATKPGFFNGLRVPDTDSAEFEVPDGTKGSWFEPVAPAKAAAAKKSDDGKGKKPEGDKKPDGTDLV